jgi:hypothetical protein
MPRVHTGDARAGDARSLACAWPATPWTAARAACSFRVHGYPGFRDDPLYKSRRTLHRRRAAHRPGQIDRLNQLFAEDHHVEVEAT